MGKSAPKNRQVFVYRTVLALLRVAFCRTQAFGDAIGGSDATRQ